MKIGSDMVNFFVFYKQHDDTSKKRHMLSVYFSASLAFPLIIVLAWHFFSRLLPFFILLKINQTEKTLQVSMTSLLLCSLLLFLLCLFVHARTHTHTHTHTHTSENKKDWFLSNQSITLLIHLRLSFPHLSLFPTLKVMPRLVCLCHSETVLADPITVHDSDWREERKGGSVFTNLGPHPSAVCTAFQGPLCCTL